MAEDPTPVGQTVSAYLTTLAANVRWAEDNDVELHPNLLSLGEVKMMEAFVRIGLHPEQQYEIGRYRADFFFPDVKLCVEVDGAQHAQRKVQDQRRDKHLQERGIKTMRIPAKYISADVDACARGVERVIDSLMIEAL